MYSVNKQDVNYLPKDAEFEIELYNPLQETILAKISFNNKTVSQEGLILRPGQRVFLERYLNEDRKFKFEVYSVEDNEGSKYTITHNGLVSVSFYKEHDPWKEMLNMGPLNNYRNPNQLYRSSFNASNPIITCSAQMDTGIISKGGLSDQKFTNSNLDFKQYPFLTTNIKLLPDSQQIFELFDIKFKKYCANCGSKISKGDKYCSECGIKL